MKKILIIGGAGFIGSTIKRLILNKEPSWRVTTKDISISESHDIRYLMKLDIENHDVIINLAAIHLLSSNIEPYVDLDVNTWAVLNLLRKIVVSSPRPAYIHFSTSSIYQIIFNQPLTNHYAISKYAADLYTQLYAKLYGVKTAVIRPSQVYGPETSHGLIARFMMMAKLRKPYTVYGDGEQISRPTHVDDVASVIKTIIDQEAWGEVYTVVGDQIFTVNEIADKINQALGIDNPRIYLEQPSEYNFDMDILGRIENNAKSLLNWKQPYTFEERLKQMVKKVRDL